MFTGENRMLGLVRRSRLTLTKFAALVLAFIAAAVFLTARHVTANPDNDPGPNTYAAEITKTYDYKFGPNPFSPGNATTTTGTFIPGEMFVPAKRCGTCHTDAHAQWRQSAHGNAF